MSGNDRHNSSMALRWRRLRVDAADQASTNSHARSFHKNRAGDCHRCDHDKTTSKLRADCRGNFYATDLWAWATRESKRPVVDQSVYACEWMTTRRFQGRIAVGLRRSLDDEIFWRTYTRARYYAVPGSRELFVPGPHHFHDTPISVAYTVHCSLQ